MQVSTGKGEGDNTNPLPPAPSATVLQSPAYSNGTNLFYVKHYIASFLKRNFKLSPCYNCCPWEIPGNSVRLQETVENTLTLCGLVGLSALLDLLKFVGLIRNKARARTNQATIIIVTLMPLSADGLGPGTRKKSELN